ncbi:tRNA epoxyqueuosine(34) reductase QueG [Magnetospirillum sp. UT-4]|uniref:tRNA epoxyqueuosine(34) reductase QueG n=1 Tax=Magnetospirillum sp. UT-4 TaxID=2681467 RepID=UPI00138133B2|nr:tRNA epoxyqueuosine(34) reductase QueG [Magnetospirillum sp. UT-4]CAA7624451.1 Epoxyqueuosine reductase [Magnetospirillum sp. UT-4]
MPDGHRSHPIKDAIRARALELGFDAVGFAAADGNWGAALEEFVAQGRHGGMAWMAERMAQRASPGGLWPEVRTVVVLGSNYGPHGDPLAPLARPECGSISVYARGKDYHDVVKKRLKALGRWMADSFGHDLKVFVDTAPVMEKPLAGRAGLGWQGRHTNLVSRDFGSWLFLAEIYTTLALPPDPPGDDHCGSCRACVPACPTGAIEPGATETGGRIDARRCISYLTIEHAGPIPVELRPALGNRIYGCDDCLAACPWNKFARPTAEADFLARAELAAPRLADLADLDEAGFREVFAGSPVKRIGHERLLRNVLVAIGNSGRPELAPVAAARLGDASATIRDAASWACSRIGNTNANSRDYQASSGR